MRSIGHSNLKSIKGKEEDKVEMFMIHITMTKETIKIGIDQIVVMGEFSLTDKVEVGQGMNKAIGEETIGTTKITAEREVEVGLEKDHFPETTIIEGTIEVQIIED